MPINEKPSQVQLNEKKVETELLRNPKYSSQWITSAAELIANYDYGREYLERYSADQLESILKAEKYNSSNKKIDIIVMLNPLLNSTQMELIYAALCNDVPIDIITKAINKDIPYSVSNYVVQAWLDGADMIKYIDYDPDQVYEIYAGIHNGVDINKYDNKLISAELMGIIRHALECNFNAIYNFDTNEILISKN